MVPGCTPLEMGVSLRPGVLYSLIGSKFGEGRAEPSAGSLYRMWIHKGNMVLVLSRRQVGKLAALCAVGGSHGRHRKDRLVACVFKGSLGGLYRQAIKYSSLC